MSDLKIVETAHEHDFVREGVRILEEKIVEHTRDSRLLLGLSGGSTPKPVYEALGKSKEIDWSKVDCFLVDERYVTPDHPDSNQRMIREALRQQIVAPNTLLPLETCVDAYEKTIAELLQKKQPVLHILGMGEDGHIASLFPGDDHALLERDRLVLHTRTDTFAVRDRITVTLPVLWKADERVFLIAGEKKIVKLRDMETESIDLVKYPAQEFLDDSTTWITRR